MQVPGTFPALHWFKTRVAASSQPFITLNVIQFTLSYNITMHKFVIVICTLTKQTQASIYIKY
jgi:hypothetical protein